VFQLSPWKETRGDKVELPYNAGRVIKIHWMFDGQILTVATQSGNLYGYLMQMPSLNATFGSMAAVLNSLTEITIMDGGAGGRVLNTIRLEIEPQMMSMGSYHIGVASNSLVMFYKWRNGENELIPSGECTSKREYRATIKQVVNNQKYAAVLTDGTVLLHTIEEGEGSREQEFPERGSSSIDIIAMTPQFLIMVDNENRIKYFYIEEMTMIAEYKVDQNIARIWPNVTGTRLVTMDM
jgi:WD repeat-containing protein 19